MISIIVCSRNKEKLEELKKNVEDTRANEVEFVVVDNSENKYGICEAYNIGIKRAKYNILCFLHEDITFLTWGWDNKVVDLLKNEDIGLIGVVGTTYLAEFGHWADVGQPFIKGHLVHTREDEYKLQIDKYSEEEGDMEVVVADGVFLATRKDVLDKIGNFDEDTFRTFHFYDLDFSLRIAQKYKIMVSTDILVKHDSSGSFDVNWFMARDRFLQKHKDKIPYTKWDLKPDRERLVKWNSYVYKE